MFVSRIMAVLAAGAALAPAVVSAAPVTNGATETRLVRVQTDDLNLASDAGVRTLNSRVRNAAILACSGDGMMSAGESQDAAACKKAALSAAQAQVDLAKARSTPRYASNPAPTPAPNTASGS